MIYLHNPYLKIVLIGIKNDINIYRMYAMSYSLNELGTLILAATEAALEESGPVCGLRDRPAHCH